ncbi:LysR family transcriptional regulator [Paraburkholderia lycopersici]|uniref:ModE molybdate transport repressor domain-containing protein n=1 Tax=Paraburkholderia lycopersici TaxID=416944 RepID=A0A1G6PCW0_9BURK|nr:LysR family transcriptional regulator [Paraburkholderia lycopersici]SDC77277.1 ModE molybdate transport repressor domain-containing protein [Paraburkholderia lycopersici]
MREVSLTLTQTFFLVAREGSYSAAARTLNISYQSAANHIRRLEQLVGERLVIAERGAKSIRLTARGTSLFQLLEPEFEVMLERLGNLIDKERPIIRIGMPQAIFYYLLPPVLKAFSALYPDVEIIGYERDTVLSDLIREGKLDVCISERYFGDPVVPQHVICSYEPALVFPAGWEGPSSEEDIPRWALDRPLVTHEPGQLLRNVAMDLLDVAGRQPRVVVSTSGSSSVKRCVEEGLGFAVIPGWCVDSDDIDLKFMRLSSVPKIPIYFGEALFLRTNPYVRTLHKLCAEAILDKIYELASGTSIRSRHDSHE